VSSIAAAVAEAKEGHYQQLTAAGIAALPGNSKNTRHSAGSSMMAVFENSAEVGQVATLVDDCIAPNVLSASVCWCMNRCLLLPSPT
jgi:hypothetical protein